MSLLLSSCYHQEAETSDAWIVTEEQMDSISFYTTHHYTQNYNFLVTADTLWLIVQQPSEVLSDMLVDSVYVISDNRLVVADIMTMPSEPVRHQTPVPWWPSIHASHPYKPTANHSRLGKSTNALAR